MVIGMGINIKGEIERVNGKELSYSEFVERYMEKNKPVVLTGLMDPHNWRASTDWVTLHSQPNFQFFSTHFGASKVQVFPIYNTIHPIEGSSLVVVFSTLMSNLCCWVVIDSTEI